MKKILYFLVNLITFGYFKKSIKKQAKSFKLEDSSDLKLNTINLPDVQALLVCLGNKDNIENISSTVSSISFTLYDISKVDVNKLKKFSKKGLLKSDRKITIIVGDCAESLQKEIENNK